MKKLLGFFVVFAVLCSIPASFSYEGQCAYKSKYRTYDGKGYVVGDYECKRPRREGDFCHSHVQKDNKTPWEIQLIFGDASLGLPMVNVYLRNADLSSMAFPSREWGGCDFQNSKMVGCVISGLSTVGTNFHKCDLSFANFGYSVVSECNFENANLENTDFLKANAENANFKNANFARAKLRNVNFKGSDFEGVTFDLTDITPGSLDSVKNLDKIVWKTTKCSNEISGYEELAMAQYQYLEEIYTNSGATDLAKRFKEDYDRVSLKNETKRSLSDAKAPKQPFALPKWAWIAIVSLVALLSIVLAVFFASRKKQK